jgi:hypothetical protein
MVLLQYAVDDGEIKLHDTWREPIGKTIELLEWMTTDTVVGFNLTFDWFHVVKLYSMFSLFPDYDARPLDHIDELAECEEAAREKAWCLKPVSALDLMLHARKGPYQSLMAREAIRVRRVPSVMAERLRAELSNKIELDGIHFNKRKKLAPQWNCYEHKDKDGNVDPEFTDVVLKFFPDGALKSLAQHVLGVDPQKILTMKDVEVPDKFKPKELGYAPYAKAIGRPGRWNGAWPQYIKHHVDHWRFNPLARRYATDDVVYTRGLALHPKFADAAPGDDDSVLACMVGAVRWRGFKVDLDRIKVQKSDALVRSTKAPTAPSAVKRWLGEVMDQDELSVLQTRGTGDVVLKEIAGNPDQEECPKCAGKGCDNCDDGKIEIYTDYWENEDGSVHPAALRCREIRDARKATKEVELYDKLLIAKRFHASFVVIGTLSTRMSGSDGLNPQGIISSNYVRGVFTLKDGGLQLDGGDFKSFEVSISAAVYKDKGLEADLRSGKKIHALMAEAIFPEQTYETIVQSKGTKIGRDFYTDGKRAVFGLNYGGDANTLVNRLKIDEDIAVSAFERFEKRYPGVKRARERIIEMFCSMRQPQGTNVEWHEPADKIESLLGFPRYFTLENKICRALYELAEKPPAVWKNVRVKVVRRQEKGEQTAVGAVRSALYGAAFGLQGANMRAAANHVIQSTGAGITKAVQRKVWDIQPVGVSQFVVLPLNIHDEIMCVIDPKLSPKLQEVVDAQVEEYRPIVPLIGIDWSTDMNSWAEK